MCMRAACRTEVFDEKWTAEDDVVMTGYDAVRGRIVSMMGSDGTFDLPNDEEMIVGVLEFVFAAANNSITDFGGQSPTRDRMVIGFVVQVCEKFVESRRVLDLGLRIARVLSVSDVSVDSIVMLDMAAGLCRNGWFLQMLELVEIAIGVMRNFLIDNVSQQRALELGVHAFGLEFLEKCPLNEETERVVNECLGFLKAVCGLALNLPDSTVASHIHASFLCRVVVVVRSILLSVVKAGSVTLTKCLKCLQHCLRRSEILSWAITELRIGCVITEKYPFVKVNDIGLLVNIGWFFLREHIHAGDFFNDDFGILLGKICAHIDELSYRGRSESCLLIAMCVSELAVDPVLDMLDHNVAVTLVQQLETGDEELLLIVGGALMRLRECRPVIWHAEMGDLESDLDDAVDHIEDAVMADKVAKLKEILFVPEE